MTIKQVLESRGIYSADLELELLRAVNGGQPEYYQHPPIFNPIYIVPDTGVPPWYPPYEITCETSTTATIEYS